MKNTISKPNVTPKGIIMNKQLATTLMALVLFIPLLLTGCWRKKAITFGAGNHGIEVSRTERGSSTRYGIDAK